MVIIEPHIEDLMLKDALQAFPDECCGFLFGTEEGDDRIRRLADILVVNNAKEGDKRRRFEIAPKDYLKAEKYALDRDLTLLGVYHSHPNHPAIPSEHDRVAAQPYFSYVIVSVYDREIKNCRSWRLDDDEQFEEEIINLYQPPSSTFNKKSTRHGNHHHSHAFAQIHQQHLETERPSRHC